MCNCPRLLVSRDFLSLMRVVTPYGDTDGLDNFVSTIPDQNPYTPISSCLTTEWMFTTAVIVDELGGKSSFICQDAVDGSINLTAEGCEFVRDVQTGKRKIYPQSGSMAWREGRFHPPHHSLPN